MRNEIGYGPTPEYLARYVVKVPLARDTPTPPKGRIRKGFVPKPPEAEAARPFYRPDTRFSYRVREPGKDVRFGPPRSTPLR
jgi:hypothetical protein